MIVPPPPAAIVAATSRGLSFVPPAPLYTDPDPTAQLVGVQLVVAAGTARESRAQAGLAALSAEAVLQTKIDGVPLEERVAGAGGSISYTVDPDAVRFTIEAMPASMPVIARDVAAAFAAPDTSDAAMTSVRAALERRMDTAEADPLFAALEMIDESYYQGGAAAPAYGTRASIAALQGADVKAFIAAHYVRGSAFATLSGVVDPSVTQAVQLALSGLPPGAEPAAPVVAHAPDAAGKRIVTSRDIGVPLVVMGFAAPALGSRDVAPMLVLSALLQNVGPRNVVTLLTSLGPSVTVVYRFDVKPATFEVVLNGGQISPSAGITAISTVLQRAATQPLSAAELDRFRTQARGQWLLGASSQTDRAWLIGAAVKNGADASAADAVAQAIANVTAADVQRVAKTYLQDYTTAIVLPKNQTQSPS